MIEVPRPATGIDAEVLAGMFPPQEVGVPSPLVGVIMGSDSDLPVRMPAIQVLRDFDVPHEVDFTSAHRTPEWMAYYGHLAVSRGLQVIIAGAGGSAHLPGDMAALTTLPVVGVAVEKQPDPLNAALGSMLEMPPDGGPMATTGKNKAAATNAGLFAVRILALADEGLVARLEERMTAKAKEVLDKRARLKEIGIDPYLESMQ